MTDPNLWNQLLVWPITNALIAFYKFFELLGIPGPLGWAIISLTILIRVILYPLMMAQLRSAKRIQALKPKLDALAAKHKNDKAAQSRAQMQFYKDEGINPAAGCLPTLLQIPILFALYNVFFGVISSTDMDKVVSEINQIIYHPALQLETFDTSFYGLSLGIKPNDWQIHGWWLLLIPVMTAALQWYQTKLMLPSTPAAGSQQSIVTKTPKDSAKKEDKPQDMALEMQKQMAIISPLMFGFFAYSFPIGLTLYWNIFGLFGLVQQLIVNREHETVNSKA